MRVLIENAKELRILLNTGEKCTSEMTGGSLAVKCIQLSCIKDNNNNQGKGWLKVTAYKEGLCSLVGVMEDVVVSREGNVFVDKTTISELLETLTVVESTNALITIQREEGKELELKIKDYGSKKFGVISKDDSGENIKFPISGLNSSNKEWLEVFRDSSGKLIDKFAKICPHVEKSDEYIEIRIEKVLEGANHYEMSLNTRLMGGNLLRYITHIQMDDNVYPLYVNTSFRIPTRLKDIFSIFKGGFTFSVSGEKEQIYKLSNSKGDTLTFFPSSTLTTPSTQIDTCVKEPDTLCSIDMELERFVNALKIHMGEKSGGDAFLSINNDYLLIKGAKSSSPAEIQLHSKEVYGNGWADLTINIKPLISGGQSVLNLLASSGNIVMNIVPYARNNKQIVSLNHRIIVVKPYAEVEGGSPTILITANVED